MNDIAFSKGLSLVEENPPAKVRQTREGARFSLHSGEGGLLCTWLGGQNFGISGPE